MCWDGTIPGWRQGGNKAGSFCVLTYHLCWHLVQSHTLMMSCNKRRTNTLDLIGDGKWGIIEGGEYKFAV